MNWHHTPEQYERVMGLKGRVSANTAARITQVSASTIKGWWRGESVPKFMYTEAQRQGRYPKPPGPVLVTEAHRRRMKRENTRRWYWRTRVNRFHPKWNPDPLLAPLHMLWMPAADVLAYLHENWTQKAVLEQLDQAGLRRYYDLRNGRKWIRYDAAERLCQQLGLVVTAVGDPVYSKQTPKEEPCSSDLQVA